MAHGTYGDTLALQVNLYPPPTAKDSCLSTLQGGLDTPATHREDTEPEESSRSFERKNLGYLEWDLEVRVLSMWAQGRESSFFKA